MRTISMIGIVTIVLHDGMAGVAPTAARMFHCLGQSKTISTGVVKAVFAVERATQKTARYHVNYASLLHAWRWSTKCVVPQS